MPLLCVYAPDLAHDLRGAHGDDGAAANENADSQQKSAPGGVPVLRARGGEELTSDPDASARVDGGVVEHHRGGRVVVEFGVDVLVQHVAREGVEVRDGRPRRVGGGGRGDAVDSTAGLLRGVVHGERDEETSLFAPEDTSGGGREGGANDGGGGGIENHQRSVRDVDQGETAVVGPHGGLPELGAEIAHNTRRRRHRVEDVGETGRSRTSRWSARCRTICAAVPTERARKRRWALVLLTTDPVRENSPSRSRVSSPAKLPITIDTISMGFSLKCLLVQREDLR